METCDLIIIGGGMAGLTAAIYSARANLKTLLLEKNTCGGLACRAAEIANFPSYDKIGGMELMERVAEQAARQGAGIREIVEIEDVQVHGRLKVVHTDEGGFGAKALIIATGREPIRLEAGDGCDHVHYCAICDGTAYRDREVIVIGGGNAGVGDALYLLNQGVGKITLVEQTACLCAGQCSQEELRADPRVTVLTGTEVAGLDDLGDHLSLNLRCTDSGQQHDVDAAGVFVYMGQAPQTAMFRGRVDLDPQGYILTDEEMRTNVSGVFAAGDVRQKKRRQLTTAMNDGTIAALSAEEYIRSLPE